MMKPFLPPNTVIYDPCYNDKTAKQYWKDLGFECINNNVDFFDVTKRPTLPPTAIIFAK
jgi:hypothetical protein